MAQAVRAALRGIMSQLCVVQSSLARLCCCITCEQLHWKQLHTFMPNMLEYYLLEAVGGLELGPPPDWVCSRFRESM